MAKLATPLVLRLIAIWSAFRAAWMGYFVISDVRSFIRAGETGPYFGIGVNYGLIVKIGAMPLKLTGIMAGFRWGRSGEVSVEILATVAYCLIAVGIWRQVNAIRLFAIFLGIVECLLLAFYIQYAIPSPILPEFRPVAIFSWSLFFVAYCASTIYLAIVYRTGNIAHSITTAAK